MGILGFYESMRARAAGQSSRSHDYKNCAWSISGWHLVSILLLSMSYVLGAVVGAKSTIKAKYLICCSSSTFSLL
jgi:hypothetical protein